MSDHVGSSLFLSVKFDKLVKCCLRHEFPNAAGEQFAGCANEGGCGGEFGCDGDCVQCTATP